MALSAAIVLDRATTTRTQKVRARVTVTNGGSTNDVTVQNIVPFVQNTAFPEPQSSSVALGQCLSNKAIAHGASGVFVFDVNFHTANPETTYDASTLSNTYNIGCLIYGDDGSITSPTVQTVTVIADKNYGSF